MYFFLFFILSIILNSLSSQTRCSKSDHKKSFINEASYYHMKYAGKKTSSGEIYDPNKFTAAHKSLPFGTKVKVINISNNKSVAVKINDSMPASNRRLIDLSYAAAKKIEMINKGTAKVKIKILSK